MATLRLTGILQVDGYSAYTKLAKATLERIAQGWTISRVDHLMPWNYAV